MKQNITIDEALEILNSNVDTIDIIEVELLEALGYVLAEDIYSDISVPSFDRSPLDGYAIKGNDTKGATKDNPVKLRVIEEIRAGYLASYCLMGEDTIKVMTGSPMPEGSDSVIKFEDILRQGDYVYIYNEVKPGSNVSYRGEDIEKGQLIVQRGVILNSAEIGILATLGKSKVKIFRAPKVAILSTGDELVDIHQSLEPGKIRNSNSYTIAAQVKKAGGEPILLGICKDDIEDIAQALKPALDWADIIITTGGVSVGDYDVVKDVFSGLGADMLFWRVAMKPGTPIVVARFGNKMIYGLSGNPAACYITFEKFVIPVLMKMKGRDGYRPRKVHSIMEDGYSKTGGQNRFIRAKTYYCNGNYHTLLSSKDSPGILSSLSGCNSLIYVPKDSAPIEKGDRVEVEILDMEEVR